MSSSREIQLDLTSCGGKEKISLNDAQAEVCQEFLDWVERGATKLQALRGYAGSGKTFLLKYALQQAWDRGLIVGNVWCCAPTHQAKKVLCEAMAGCPVNEVVTAHSLLGLRPEKVTFSSSDENVLASLLAIPADSRTSDDEAVIDGLQIKRNKSEEGCQDFVSVTLKKGIESVRLILVDECSMIDRYLFGLFNSLIANSDLHPDLQILFIGDPAQLPPINESLSKTLSLPHFSELTKVVRYSGSILDYCNQVRMVADYEWLHRRMIEDDSLMILQSFEVMAQIRELYSSGESIRFIAATNKRVEALNYQIRSLLHDGDCFFYERGDVILTLNAVQRDSHGAYDVACAGRNAKLEAHTSTLLELGDPCLPGDFVSLGASNGTRLTEEAFCYTSSFGTKFERLIYRYRSYDSGETFGQQAAICLINPEQYSQWRLEIKNLLARARTTQTRSKKKGARGQEGDSAKEVWKEFGLKSWVKWADGRPVSDYEYRKIKSQLWADYYGLLGFADQASYSYASTCHRVQGVTLDVVVVDMQSIISGPSRQWQKEGDESSWDTRKLLYTAATRARKQVVFMI